jgi:hypothetical protein
VRWLHSHLSDDLARHGAHRAERAVGAAVAAVLEPLARPLLTKRSDIGLNSSDGCLDLMRPALGLEVTCRGC